MSFVAVFALGWRHGLIARKALAAPYLAGISCLAFSVFLLPAGKRMGDMVGGGDDSILNRFELWRTAGPMSFIKPLTGIGGGESGYFFSQWYQPERLNYSYTGLLNSYLEIAVERGLPVFAGVMALGFVVVASVWFKGGSGVPPLGAKPDGIKRRDAASTLQAAGLIESGQRHLLQARLKLGDSWWDEQNAHATARLRVFRAHHQRVPYQRV